MTGKLIKRLFLLLLVPLCTTAQQNQPLDTTTVYQIPEVIVTGQLNVPETRSTAPLQILSASKINQLNILQVSDAVKHFTSVTVKDYGGIGGLKTASVRSLGANHTAVTYDGITVSDQQTGQIDIGRFSLDNVELISLNNGQTDNIFLPARNFAAASVLNIRTQTPKFDNGKYLSGKASIKGGSFGLINPALSLYGKLNPEISATISGEYLYSNGEYPFILSYGNKENDLSSREKRKNTDVTNFRAEGSVYGNFSEKEIAYIKAYYYQAERGLPGSTILYNPNQNLNQRIWDKTFFSQAHYQRELSEYWIIQANAKYNWSWQHYINEAYLSSVGKEDNTYIQHEYYLTASVLFRAFQNLSFSLSTDGTVNTMSADIYNFACPIRYSQLSVVAAKYVSEKVLATASLLNTFVKETVKNGEKANNQNRFSPYASISVKPFSSQDFRIRFFYKNIFRLPTFNDLYYTGVGNRTLEPELTNQFNLGATYFGMFKSFISSFSLTCDGYYNNVKNKIVALPTKDIFVWSMLNYGKVSITGIDLNGETRFDAGSKTGIILGGTYTYQRAFDITEPGSRTYKHQIPYTPRVCGSAKAGLETQWLNIYYSLVWSGHRYTLTQNYAENRLEGYYDHSISASRSFKLQVGTLAVNLELLNLSDKNYQVIKGYPMPGRSFRATVSYKF